MVESGRSWKSRQQSGNSTAVRSVRHSGFAVNITCDSDANAKQLFPLMYDYTRLQYVVDGVAAFSNSSHALSSLVNISYSESHVLDIPFQFVAAALPCNPPATSPDRKGHPCLYKQCGAGQEPSDDELSCQPCASGFAGMMGACVQCGPGTLAALDRTLCDECPEGTAGSDGRTCEPCKAGEEAGPNRTHCEICAAGTAGVGGTCTQCPDGEQVQDPSQPTSCKACPPGTAGIGGVCEECDDGHTPDASSTACTPCAAGTVGLGGRCTVTCQVESVDAEPNENRTDCICKPGYYNTSRHGWITS
jgi:hypothetical protein